MSNISELDDLRYTRIFFSWSNKRFDNGYITKKLETAVINQVWMDMFPKSYANFLRSEHSPIIIEVEIPKFKKGSPFKFFNYWTSIENFQNVIKRAWGSTNARY